MKELILPQLVKIGERHRVKILYAVESGSRSWGFHSESSDYDVRFIYIHQPEWYLSIDPQGVGRKRDVIEEKGITLDMSGWEITKALRLYRKSNPALLEWLRSRVVYMQEDTFISKLLSLEHEVFSPEASLHHYLNMAKRNHQEYIKTSVINTKLLFNILRPILSSMWIIKYNEFPPNDFSKMFLTLISDNDLRNEVANLLEQRVAGIDLQWKRDQTIDEFMETELLHIVESIKWLQPKNEDPTGKLDLLFRDTLQVAWGSSI